MKCQDVRRFLYAFSDGALEVKENLEILGHLNMCPRCAARADADAQLKQRLAGIFSSESAPEPLRQAILTQIRPSPPRQRSHRWIVRLAPPLGIAAALLIIAGIWWSHAPANSAELTANNVAAFDGGHPVAARELAAAFRAGHQRCSALGRAHHRAGLSRHLPMLQQQLSAELGMDVLAPNWHSKSLRFVSACNCGMPDGAEGAHLVYERMHVETASLYTLRPTPLFEAFERDIVDGCHYRVGYSEGINLVAWRGRNADYLLCAEGQPDRVDQLIRDLIVPIRVALAETGINPLAGLALTTADVQDSVPRLFDSIPTPAVLIKDHGVSWFITRR